MESKEAVIDLSQDDEPVFGPVRHKKGAVSKKHQRTARRWTFTDFEMKVPIATLEADSRVQFVEWANELAPGTGRKHRQARIGFKQPQSRGVLQALLDSKVHCDVEMDREKSHYYCTGLNPQGDGPKLQSYPAGPEQEYFEPKLESCGKEVVQGERTDIQSLYAAVKSGSHVLELFEEHTRDMFKYHGAVTKLQKALDDANKPGFSPLEVYFICGEPGTGKSHWADCVYGEKQVFHVGKSQWDTKFLEGYDPSVYSTLVLDGFDGSWMTFKEFEHLLDGYAWRVNVKHTSCWARWKRIVVTSNHRPQAWYPKVFANTDEGKRLYKALVGRVAKYEWWDKCRECEHNLHKRYV